MNPREREIYDEFQKRFPNTKVTKSFVRQELPLLNNKTSYEFDLNGDKVGKETEKKIVKQNNFVLISLGLFLLREVDGREGTGVLQTYPNDVVFVAATGFVPGDLELIYNGLLTAQIESDVIFPNGLPTALFRKVNTTQQKASTNSFSEGSIEDGLIDMVPTLILPGNRQKKITVTIPSVTTPQYECVTAGSKHKLVLVGIGFDIANVNS